MSDYSEAEHIPHSFQDRVIFAAAWWWVAAVVEELAGVKPQSIEPIGVRFTIPTRGTMTLTGDDERCEVSYSEGGDWQKLHDQLDRIVRSAEKYRRSMWKMNADAAIEHWYRSRAAGSRMTLKDLAAATGYNYTYLSQVKSAYDKAGGWGSSKQKPKSKT